MDLAIEWSIASGIDILALSLPFALTPDCHDHDEEMPLGSGKAGIQLFVSELVGRLWHQKLHAPKVAGLPAVRSPPQLSRQAAPAHDVTTLS